MNGIIGMTALTLDTQLTRAQRENLMIVQNLASNLLTIIDDIVSQAHDAFSSKTNIV